jgi:hypothetical protein
LHYRLDPVLERFGIERLDEYFGAEHATPLVCVLDECAAFIEKGEAARGSRYN